MKKNIIHSKKSCIDAYKSNCKYPEGRAWAGTARRRAGVPWAVLGLDNRLVVPARHGTMCRSCLKI